MDAPEATIAVHSRQQAMDWSLVLISQGIESTIEGSEDSEDFRLVVSPAEFEAAREAIEKFRTENQGWPWQQSLFHSEYLFDWGSLAWVALLALFYALSENMDLRAVGLVDSQAILRGEWWRVFTGIWLHGDLAHLACNATLGVLLLGLAMGRYGTGLGLLVGYLAGAGGNAIACVLGPSPHYALGASGMVMGTLGMLAMGSLSHWYEWRKSKKLAACGVAGGTMLFVLLGLTPGTDILAHFGGFVTGLALGGLLMLFGARKRRPGLDLTAGLVFALLVILPWILALRTKV